jgi:hypothetical protein
VQADILRVYASETARTQCTNASQRCSPTDAMLTLPHPPQSTASRSRRLSASAAHAEITHHTTQVSDSNLSRLSQQCARVGEIDDAHVLHAHARVDEIGAHESQRVGSAEELLTRVIDHISSTLSRPRHTYARTH